jgi:hypothetical protein
VPVVGQDLLGEPEVQHLAEEAGGLVDVLGGDEDVVQPWRRDADQVLRPRRRVGQRQHVADLLHAVHQLDHVPGWRVEPDRLAPPGAELAGRVPLDLSTGRFQPAGVEVQVCGLGDLERHVVESVAGGLAQYHGVMLLFVPALQEDPVALAGGLHQAEHLGVIGGAQLQVRRADLDVLQPQDPVAHRALLTCAWSGSAG